MRMIPAAVLAAATLCAQPAFADQTAGAPAQQQDRVGRQQAPSTPPFSDRLQYNPPVDLAVTAMGGAGWLLSEAYRNELGPRACRWCELTATGAPSVNALDRAVADALTWHDTTAAGTVSSVVVFGLAPAAAVGIDAWLAARAGVGRNVSIDALLIGEAAVISADLEQIVKFTVARRRPDAPGPAQPSLRGPPGADANVSFYSGHTSLAFALTTASWEIASLRGYPGAGWILRVGVPLGVLAGYLRIAADRHYLTDVLAGAAVGSGVGFAVPRLFHAGPSRSTRTVRACPVFGPAGAHGLMVAYAW